MYHLGSGLTGLSTISSSGGRSRDHKNYQVFNVDYSSGLTCFESFLAASSWIFSGLRSKPKVNIDPYNDSLQSPSLTTQKGLRLMTRYVSSLASSHLGNAKQRQAIQVAPEQRLPSKSFFSGLYGSVDLKLHRFAYKSSNFTSKN